MEVGGLRSLRSYS
jgi:hypothetical protein